MPLYAALQGSKQMQMAFENESKTFLTSENLKCRVEFSSSMLNTLYMDGWGYVVYIVWSSILLKK